MTIQEKMHSGELYLPMDGALFQEQMVCLDCLYDFNQTRPAELARREALLREMFAEIGEGCCIEPPFHANWGGRHVHFSSHIYANINLTLVDGTHIYVEDYTQFGPTWWWPQRATPCCRSCGRGDIGITPPFTSAATAGSAREPSWCLVCGLRTM